MVILFYFGEIKRTTFQQLASSTPRLECRTYYLNSGLTQLEQKYAKLFLHDLQRGDVAPSVGKCFRDYINDYQNYAENKRVDAVVSSLGLDKKQLLALIKSDVNDKNINRFGRFDNLISTVDKVKAKAYFEKLEGGTILPFKLNVRISQYLQQFILAQTDDNLADVDVEIAENS